MEAVKMQHTPGPRDMDEYEAANIMADLERIFNNTRGRKTPIKRAISYLTGRLVDVRFGGGENANDRVQDAAPELLDAVYCAFAELNDNPHTNEKTKAYTVEKLRAAIAKAEGR